MVLTRRQLYMLPTTHGLLFTLVVLAIFLASVNYNNGLAYGLTFMLVSIALISMLHTHRNVSGLAVEVLNGEPVFAGENAKFRLNIRNPQDFSRVCVWVTCGDHRQNFYLHPQSAIQLEVPVAATHRGYVSCPPLRLSSAYPLGLQYTWSAPVRSVARGIVYPRPAGDRPLPFTRSLRAQLAPSGASADGDDFAGLREYVAGDPPRHVHWKAVATHQKLLTKKFSGERNQDQWLQWTDTAGSSEARLSQLSQWVVVAERATFRYGLRIPGAQLSPDRGSRHYHRCLEALALWGFSDGAAGDED